MKRSIQTSETLQFSRSAKWFNYAKFSNSYLQKAKLRLSGEKAAGLNSAIRNRWKNKNNRTAGSRFYKTDLRKQHKLETEKSKTRFVCNTKKEN